MPLRGTSALLLTLGLQAKSFEDNMRMEFRIGCRQVHSHDFQEGVRAVIIDKDNAPKWDPATLSGVSEKRTPIGLLVRPHQQDSVLWLPLSGQSSIQNSHPSKLSKALRTARILAYFAQIPMRQNRGARCPK